MDRAFIPLLLRGGDETIITVTSAGGLTTRQGRCLIRRSTTADADDHSPGASGYQGSKPAQMRLNDHLMMDYGQQVRSL